MTTEQFLARLNRWEVYSLGILYGESDNLESLECQKVVNRDNPELVGEFLQTIPFRKVKKVIKDKLQSLTDKGIPHSHFPEVVNIDAKLGGE